MLKTDTKIRTKAKKLNTKIELKNLLFGLLVVWLPLSVAGLFIQNRWIKFITEDQNALYDKSFKSSKIAQGFACGLLTVAKAEKYLNETELVKRVLITPSAFFGLRINPDKENIENGYNESCYYESKTNSEKRVNLLVANYSNEIESEKMFDFFLSGGQNDAREIINSSSDSSRLMYSNAGITKMIGSRLITVSACNGNPSENETFTRPIFDELMLEIQ